MIVSLLASSLILTAQAAAPVSTLDASSTAARLQYVIGKLEAQGFSESEIARAFGDPRVKIYSPPQITGQPIDWQAFEKGLLSAKSLADGRAFTKKYSATLTAAQKKYGVDKNAIVAILRMESTFGKWMGSHLAFNVFYSDLLRTDRSESKWKWAGDNLVALMVHARKAGVKPLDIKSSWAGAVGVAQFLPATILAFGKDGNKDGKVTMTNTHDSIASAANFLAAHGWKKNSAKALASYYGSSVGYPQAALKYAKALNPPPAKKATVKKAAPVR